MKDAFECGVTKVFCLYSSNTELKLTSSLGLARLQCEAAKLGTFPKKATPPSKQRIFAKIKTARFESMTARRFNFNPLKEVCMMMQVRTADCIRGILLSLVRGSGSAAPLVG
jgi:hypothetical protein